MHGKSPLHRLFWINNRIEMKFLLIGLGNIGVEYSGTRHNIGFDVVDAMAVKFSLE